MLVTKYDYCKCGHQLRYHDQDTDYWIKTGKNKTTCKHCDCTEIKIDFGRRGDSIAAANDMLSNVKAKAKDRTKATSGVES